MNENKSSCKLCLKSFNENPLFPKEKIVPNFPKLCELCLTKILMCNENLFFYWKNYKKIVPLDDRILVNTEMLPCKLCENHFSPLINKCWHDNKAEACSSRIFLCENCLSTIFECNEKMFIFLKRIQYLYEEKNKY